MKLSNTRLVAIVAIFVVVSCSVLPPTTSAQEQTGFLRIKAAEYPVQVPRSYSFTIRLAIEYGFHGSFEFYAAIYEGGRGRFDHALWEGTTQQGISVGETSMEATVESPSSEGQWVITAYLFLRDATGSHYFTDTELGPGYAEISIKVADNARLTLRAPHANIPIVIDDMSVLTNSEGTIVQEFEVMSTHTIIAPDSVTIAAGWRTIFVSWNATDKLTSKTILMTTDVLMTLELRDEFYLDIASDAGSAEGAGWYASGSVASFSVNTPVPAEGWQGLLGAQKRFTGWTGDVESSAPNENIVMDRPHRVVANWTTDNEGTLWIGIVIAGVTALGIAVYIIRRTRMEAPAEVSQVPAAALCMFCGADIDADATHCQKCGKSQISPD